MECVLSSHADNSYTFKHWPDGITKAKNLSIKAMAKAEDIHTVLKVEDSNTANCTLVKCVD